MWWICWWMILLELTRSILMPVMVVAMGTDVGSMQDEGRGNIIRNRRRPEAYMWSSCGRRLRLRGDD